MTRPPHAFTMPLVLALLWATAAPAQQPVSSLTEGLLHVMRVPKEQQRAATKLVEEGNKLLNDAFFPLAEKKYSDALHIWNHPAIHYNLALALPQPTRPTEVYLHMRAAMQHGEVPLGQGRFKHARNLTERMSKEYARVEILCDSGASAQLSSGGWLVRREDGSFEGLVPPGTHLLVTAQKGYPSNETKLTLTAGEKVRLRIGARRPWAVWKPLAAMGAGAAIAAGGGLLHSRAGSHFRAFDEGIDHCGGCVPDSKLLGQRSRAKTLQGIAVGSYALGSAAFLTGLVFLYNNQLQSQVLPAAEPGETQLAITPLLGKQNNGLLVNFRF